MSRVILSATWCRENSDYTAFAAPLRAVQFPPGVTARQHDAPTKLFRVLDGLLDMFIGMAWTCHPRYSSILLTHVNTLRHANLRRRLPCFWPPLPLAYLYSSIVSENPSTWLTPTQPSRSGCARLTGRRQCHCYAQSAEPELRITTYNNLSACVPFRGK